MHFLGEIFFKLVVEGLCLVVGYYIVKVLPGIHVEAFAKIRTVPKTRRLKLNQFTYKKGNRTYLYFEAVILIGMIPVMGAIVSVGYWFRHAA